MTSGEPQKIRIELDEQAGFPLPEYEKVLRIVGTPNADFALLETSTGSTGAHVVGGVRLQAGEVAEVHTVQVEPRVGGPDIATLWVTTDD